MKKLLLLFIIGIALTLSMGSKASATPIADTIQYSSGYFVDVDANKTTSPYYRWYNEDWGWTHNAISATFSTATLNISAFDVDYALGERDEVFAWNNSGVKTSLGFLAGSNNTWAFTEFTLDLTYFNTAIAGGLDVWIDIDSTNPYASYGFGDFGITLAKSTLCLDGPCDMDPKPPVIPEPSTYLLLGSGIAGLAFWRRRQQAKKA